MTDIFSTATLLILKVTDHCNFNCAYCYAGNKNSKHISMDTIKSLTHRIVDDRLKTTQTQKDLTIVLHGGEPLMLGHQRLMRILNFMSKTLQKNGVGHRFSIQTNLTLLDDTYLKILKKYNVSLGVSFDGVNDGNFSRTDKYTTKFYEEKIDLLNRYGIRFGILIVCNKNNIDTLAETTEFIRQKTDKTYKLNYMEDVTGCGLDVTGDIFFEKVWRPEIDEYLRTGHHHDSNMKRKIELFVFNSLYYIRPFNYICTGRFCGAGTIVVSVDVHGNILQCGRFHKEIPYGIMGEIGRKYLFDVDQIKSCADLLVEKDKAVREKECDNCRAKDICEVGCPAFSLHRNPSVVIKEQLVCRLHMRLYDYFYGHRFAIADTFLNEFCDGKRTPFGLLERKSSDFAESIFDCYDFSFPKDDQDILKVCKK